MEPGDVLAAGDELVVVEGIVPCPTGSRIAALVEVARWTLRGSHLK
jgi:hypothetical protein